MPSSAAAILFTSGQLRLKSIHIAIYSFIIDILQYKQQIFYRETV